MKIALVHDYLVRSGGAEKVLEALHEVWPSAPIYTSVVDKKILSSLKIKPANIKTNLVSRLPFPSVLYKHYVPLYPIAFNATDVEDADVVISSSTFAAKFVNKKKAIHFCYLHTVPRFLWGYETELSEPLVKGLNNYFYRIYKKLTPIKNYLRRLDYEAAQKVDFFIANSKEVQKRIKKHYGRDSTVIYPPVDTERFASSSSQRPVTRDQGYFLVVSRLGGYKKVDIVVEAFNKLGLPLKIVGYGPQFDYLKSIAKENIELLGRRNDQEVTNLLLGCTALIFPTYEDFGIVPVEAMAAGKPVIAYRKGGAIETVVEGITGEFFGEQSPDAIIDSVKKFKPKKYKPEACRAQARKFSKEEFKRKIKPFVEEAWEESQKSKVKNQN